MEVPVLAVLGAQPPPDFAKIEDQAEVRHCDDAGLADALSGADALFVWDFTSRAVPGAWPAADVSRLRWVHIASAGVDTLMFDALRSSDVVVTNSRGVFDGAIAEYVLGLVLSFAKDIPGTLRLQSDGRWRHRETERIAGREALVVGTGPIGRAVARLLRAVGMRVAAVGRTARADDDFGQVYAAGDLHTALAGADYVICVAPLTDQTTGMFDAGAFAAMRPGARFVNVGRGAHVVTDDLVAALRTGRLGGAALDVFDTEPLPPGSPLWSMSNVVISPHMSGDFIGWKPALVEVFTDNFARWVSGRPLRNVVDKRLGYVTAGRTSGAANGGAATSGAANGGGAGGASGESSSGGGARGEREAADG
ncbi:MAG: D-2-hydroxyacid dehydrogenase [Micromonosporaceae bacterium]